MPWYRSYIDKTNGDHARIIDGEASDRDAYEKALKIKKGERLNQTVELTFPAQAHQEQ